VGDGAGREQEPSAADREIIGALLLALDGAGCGITIQDQSLAYIYIENLPFGFAKPEGGAASDASIFGAMLGEKLKLAKMALMASGETQRLTTLAQNRMISFSMTMLKEPASDGRIVTTVQDITKARRREATMRTLLLELSHRSKNLLAIIQGLAAQSAKHARTLEDFLPAFTGRLHAVSSAQDVIVDANWQGASLHELAKRQLAMVASDRDMDIRYIGPDLELDSNQSLHIGLALHELAMMTAMLQLSERRRITIETGWDKGVFISWKSEPGPKVPAAAAGFGPVLLERVVPVALSGKGAYQATPEAVEWRVDFPLKLAPARKPKNLRRTGP
jgi:two-component sensor histidine kinase